MKTYSKTQDLAWLLLRLIVGIGIATHGYAKIFTIDEMGVRSVINFAGGVGAMGFPLPLFFAWAAALAEFLGGILIALGLFTRTASFFVMVTMAVALYRHLEDPFNVKEKALLYFAAGLAILIAGAGRVSLDYLFCGRRRKQESPQSSLHSDREHHPAGTD